MKYADWVDDFESGTIEWNIETACYALGAIESDRLHGDLTDEEAEKLKKMLPLTKEDLAKIDF